jgi:ABC-type uncharacterized transport system ATPase subunit
MKRKEKTMSVKRARKWYLKANKVMSFNRMIGKVKEDIMYNSSKGLQSTTIWKSDFTDFSIADYKISDATFDAIAQYFSKKGYYVVKEQYHYKISW